MSDPEGKAPRAVILGCSELTLSKSEKEFFAQINPLGFILFARNCKTPDQISALIDDLRQSVGRVDAPVLIDQEGGRVARLKPPHWREAPPGAIFGRLARQDIDQAREAVFLNARLIGRELLALGITVDCAPVLDLPAPDGHEIIGDRALSDDPAIIGELGRAWCDGLLAEGVLPVIKHIPGHGRARADSHLELPVVESPHAVLAETDFVPFAALSDMPWAMTAHILYTDLDGEVPATHSRKIINAVIREEIGFSGVLVSDDIGMQALNGDLRDRAAAALEAGCDLALHCSGEMEEMTSFAASISHLDHAAVERLARAEKLRLECAAKSKSQSTLDMETRLSHLIELVKETES